ncbi:MAG: M12 family metallo-peptidase [Thermoanaerobaculia bacterium]
MTRKSSILLIHLALGLLVAGSGYASQGLFTGATLETQIDLGEDAASAIRTRFVEVDLGQIESATGVAAPTLVLNLFPDSVFTARLDRAGSTVSGGRYWTGHLKEISSGTVSLVVRDGALTGSVNTGEDLFQIRHLRDGVHSVREADPASFAQELEPIEVSGAGADLPKAVEVLDDGSNIDILVVYTPTARDNAGGTTAIKNLIDLAVVESNQSYANSGISQRLSLGDVQEVAYSEVGFNWSTTLSRLRGTSDGYMDNVHGQRDASCADAVVLIVGSSTSCGIGYLMTTVSPGFEDAAFSVVSYNCATGYYSFAHELGHNMGARHDWYVDDSTTPYAHSHGFVNAPDQWRTIMAYNSECSDAGPNCTRLQYWSNPLVSFGGDPMGVPAGTSTACIEGNPAPGCDADNHLTLDKTTSTFANFRDSSSCGGLTDIFEDGFESGDTTSWTSTVSN